MYCQVSCLRSNRDVETDLDDRVADQDQSRADTSEETFVTIPSQDLMCRFQQARLDLLHRPVTVVITDSDRTCRLVRLDRPDRVREHARDRSGDQACQDPFEGREGSDEVGTLATFDDCRARLFVCSTSE